jgi:molybdopterin-guanine dinucleotide biosynthesis adapter protein
MIFDKVVGIVGWKNSGKTTLVEKLVRELASRGLQVSTVKHAHHDFDLDHPGKDSYRHRAAGAREVLVASARRWALLHERDDLDEPSLADLLSHLGPCDVVLVEGFKRGPQRKIEVRRSVSGGSLLADCDPTICAVAADDPLLAGRHRFLPLDDAEAIAVYLCSDLLGVGRPDGRFGQSGPSSAGIA